MGVEVAAPDFGWGVRLAVRAALFLLSAVAVAVVVAVLSGHRAEAATPATKGSLARSPGPVVQGSARTRIPATAPVRQTLQPVVQQVAPATAPVRQTLQPVVQQVAPATAPVRQTLQPVVQQVAPATSPIGRALGGVVAPITGAPNPTASGPGHGGLLDVGPPGLTPTARSGTGLQPIGAPDVTARAAGGSGAASLIGPGTSVVQGAIRGLGSSLDAASLGASANGPRLPASSWPFGAGTVPTPLGPVGGEHGSGGPSGLLAGRWLVIGLLVAIIGLIALWSAGRPAPRPEVSPA